MMPSITSVLCLFLQFSFRTMQLSVKCHFVVHPTYFTTEQILTLVGPALKSNSPLMKWNETPNGSTPASSSLPIDRCLIERGGFCIAKFIYWREIHVYQINTYSNIHTYGVIVYIYIHVIMMFITQIICIEYMTRCIPYSCRSKSAVSACSRLLAGGRA